MFQLAIPVYSYQFQCSTLTPPESVQLTCKPGRIHVVQVAGY